MAICNFFDGTVIGDYKKPYIVAEMNSSHCGDMEIAKEMIRKAKEIGCDCVKFQSWTSETLYSKVHYEENRMAKRIIQKFSFSEEQLLEAAEYCSLQGIAFASTPYSNEEAKFLAKKCKVPFIKVASMELNHYQYLKYIAEFGQPIVLSTGMGEMEEIKAAVKVIETTGNKNICILHCVSSYPAEPNIINLNNLLELRETFPDYPIGYSDHTLGSEVAAASVALGAALIEKHFSLDKSKVGMDNQMATEPDEMKKLVESCHNVYHAMGVRERIVTDLELEQRTKMRRSVIAKKDLKAGTTLTLDDLDAKRPGTGIPADKLEALVGKELLRDIDKDEMILEDDLK
jgi:N-acetylneuraminate synthase